MGSSILQKSLLLSLVAATCINGTHAHADCTEENTTDLRAVQLDLDAPGLSYPLPVGWFTIENIGPKTTLGRIHFNVYEVDSEKNEIQRIAYFYVHNLIQPGKTLTRMMPITPYYMIEGRHYKSTLSYECDTDSSNNSSFQTAFNIVGPPPDPTIFHDGFEPRQSILAKDDDVIW